MNLQNWIEEARQHWQEHRPKMYQQYLKAGNLDQKLKQAAEQTYLEVDELEQQGYQPHEAWEIVREKYLMLPDEDTVPDLNQRQPAASRTPEQEAYRQELLEPYRKAIRAKDNNMRVLDNPA